MMHIIGIGGSLRKASINAGLLRAAETVVPDNMTLETFTLHDIPLYNGDLEEAEGVPVKIATLQDKIAAADGLLISTPEYNHSIPGVVKNALDWLTRPSEGARVFGNKPTALMGASPSGFGSFNAQTAWLPIFRLLNMRPFFQTRLTVAQAYNVFDDDGNLTDEKTLEQLKSYLAEFAAFI